MAGEGDTVPAERLSEAQRDILLELSELMGRRRSVTEVFGAFMGRVVEAAAFDYVSLIVMEQDGRLATTVAAYPEVVRLNTQGVRYRRDELALEMMQEYPEGFEFVPAKISHQAIERLMSANVARAWGCPLFDGDEIIGLITVGRLQPGRFDRASVTFLKAASRIVGTAVVQDRHIERLERQAARSALISDLALLLNTGEVMDVIFDRILALLEQAVQFDYVGLMEVTENPQELRQVGSRPVIGRAKDARSTFAETGIDRMFDMPGVVQSRTDRVQAEETGALRDAGITRLAAVVLRHGGEPVGAFVLGRRENWRFAEDECQFMLTLCSLLGQTIGNRRRVERIEQDAARTALFNELSFLLNAGEPVESLFDRLPKLIRRAIPCEYVGLATVDAESDGRMRTIDWNARDRENLHAGNRSATEVALDSIDPKGPQVIQFPLAAGMTPLIGELYRAGLRRSMLALLKDGEAPIGLLHIARGADRAFSTGEMSSLDVVGRIFAQAVANQLRITRAASEAEEERIIALVGAVAAGVADPPAVVAELFAPISMFVPSAIVAFGYVDGDDVRFLSPRGETTATVGSLLRKALDDGQLVVGSVDEDSSGRLAGLARQLGLARTVHTRARSAGSLVGLLSVGTTDPEHKFSERDLRILRRITQVVGPAMAHAEVTQRRAAEAEEQRIVVEVAAAVARESHPWSLLQAVVEPLRGFVSRPLVGFGHLTGDGVVYYVRDIGEWRTELTVLERKAIAEGQVHVREVDEYVPEGRQIRKLRVHAGTLTATIAGGEATGLLLVGSRDPDFDFGERDLRLVRLLAQIVGPAMEAALASQRALQDAEEQRIVAEIGAIASREPDPEKLLKACQVPLGRLVPELILSYMFVDIASGSYCFSSAPARRFELGPLGREAIATGQAWGGAEQLAHDHPGRDAGVQTLALTANYATGAVAGLLGASCTAVGHAFNERELRVFRQATQIIGPAMETARANEEVARQSELYNLILSSLSEAVVVLNPSLQVVFENANGHKITHALDPERTLRTVDADVPVPPSSMREDFARAVLEHVPVRGRTRVELDGQTVWYDYELVPLNDPNLALLAVASDVTAEVLREQEQEQHREQLEQAARLSALGELIGGVAHELNNPLTAILGFAEVMALAAPATDHSEEVGIIQKEALRARNIVRDLLFIARPGPVEQGRFAMSDVVGHVERLRRTAWAVQGLNVNIDLADPGEELMGNENQLTQVLLNLVTNAEHAVLAAAKKELSIRTRRSGESELLLEVRDTGAGMDEATSGRVFEPFFTTKQSGQGTGLGLSLSYSIVASHRGRIEVESKPRSGSAFRVFLPLAEAVPAMPPQPMPQAPGRRARVLVVDDEPNLRKVCQRMIASMGHDCAVAANAAAAVALARETAFDVVLCDYRLAEETADDVVRDLIAIDPTIIRRIAIATGATTDSGVLALTARYNLTLVAKPYGFDEISQLLTEAELQRAS
jgi:signal transduction histidine kinase/CheY-like chemotaxis protein